MAGQIATLLSGLLFGFGLATATMIRPESVLAFLQFDDLGLLLVLGSAVMLNLLVFHWLPRWRATPMCLGQFQVRRFTLDRRSLLGGVIFGIGWGLCGVCPGPALAAVGAGSTDLLIALAGIVAGAFAHGWWESNRQDNRRDNTTGKT